MRVFESIRIVSPLLAEKTMPSRWGICCFGGVPGGAGATNPFAAPGGMSAGQGGMLPNPFGQPGQTPGMMPPTGGAGGAPSSFGAIPDILTKMLVKPPPTPMMPPQQMPNPGMMQNPSMAGRLQQLQQFQNQGGGLQSALQRLMQQMQ